MSDHTFVCPGCGQTYICDQDDQDPPCCNREALRDDRDEWQKMAEQATETAAQSINTVQALQEALGLAIPFLPDNHNGSPGIRQWWAEHGVIARAAAAHAGTSHCLSDKRDGENHEG